ncbi:MAG: hypothetical protein Roseis2KO_45230 [Roseivirga sp.]
MDYSFQISLAFLLILVFIIPFAAMRQFRLYKEAKDAMTSDETDRFVFKKNAGEVLWLVFALLPVALTSRMNLNTISIVIFGIFALFIILILLSNKWVIIVDDNGVRSTDSYLNIKSFDIMGIRVSDHEVSIHSEKRVNRHRFKSKKLIGQDWPEFQEAIIRYASQFDHIKIEQV